VSPVSLWEECGTGDSDTVNHFPPSCSTGILYRTVARGEAWPVCCRCEVARISPPGFSCGRTDISSTLSDVALRRAADTGEQIAFVVSSSPRVVMTIVRTAGLTGNFSLDPGH
jgi:hypothetical protein